MLVFSRVFKRVILIFFVCFVLIVGLVLIFKDNIEQYILDMVIKKVEKSIEGSFSYGYVDIRLFKGFRMDNLDIKLKDGTEISASSITAQFSLFSLMFKPRIYDVNVKKLSLYLPISKDSIEKKIDSISLPDFTFRIDRLSLEDATIFYDTIMKIDHLNIFSSVNLTKRKLNIHIIRLNSFLKWSDSSLIMPVTLRYLASKIYIFKKGLFLNLDLVSNLLVFKGSVKYFVNNDFDVGVKYLRFYPSLMGLGLEGVIKANGEIGYYRDSLKADFNLTSTAITYSDYTFRNIGLTVRGSDSLKIYGKAFSDYAKIFFRANTFRLNFIKGILRLTDIDISSLVNMNLALDSLKTNFIYKDSTIKVNMQGYNIVSDNKKANRLFTNVSFDMRRFILSIDTVFVSLFSGNLIANGKITKDSLFLHAFIENINLNVFLKELPYTLGGETYINGRLCCPLFSGNIFVRNNFDTVKIVFDSITSKFTGRAHILFKKSLASSIIEGAVFYEDSLFNFTSKVDKDIPILIRGKMISDTLFRIDTVNALVMDIPFYSNRGFDVCFGNSAGLLQRLSFTFGSGKILFSTTKGLSDLDLRLKDIPVDFLSYFLHTEIAGNISGYLKLDNETLLNPKLSTRIIVRDFYFGPMNTDSILLGFNFVNNRIDSFLVNVFNKSHLTWVRGNFNIKMDTFDIYDINVRGFIEEPGDWILFPLKKNFPYKGVHVWTDNPFSITGSLKKLKLHLVGERDLHFQVDSLYFNALSLSLFKLESGSVFVDDKNRLIIKDISAVGYIGNKMGHIKNGNLILPITGNKPIKIYLSVRKMPVVIGGIVSAVASTNVNKEIFIKAYNDGHVLITGDVFVNSCVLKYEFGGNNVVQQAEVDTSLSQGLIDVNLHIIGNRNIWLRNELADIELVPDLTLRTNTTDRWAILGKLRVRTGNFYYLDHVFKIDSGSISFSGRDVPDPSLNIWGSLPMRRVYYRDSQTERVKILLHLSGLSSSPVPEFFSDPPLLSESDILTYLALHLTTEELSRLQEREVINSLVGDLMTNLVNTELKKNWRGGLNLDYFEVLPSTDANAFKISVGKYIGNRWFFLLSNNFSNETGVDQVSGRVEYFLTPNLELKAEKHDTTNYRFSIMFRKRF